MNIKQFKEWLDQFDDDVIVQVLMKEPSPPYESFGDAQPQEFHAEEYDDYDYVDFRDNQFVTHDKPYYNRKYLTLGGSE